MLRVWGGFWVGIVCVAALWIERAAGEDEEACGPLYLDPNTLGGLRGGYGLRVCNGSVLHHEWAHDAVNVKGWRSLKHMEWFGILPNCSQVALGVSVNRNVEGGLRGNTNSVGISYGSNVAYWGYPETPTVGGLNQDFTERLVSVGKKSRGYGMWIMVNYETGILWYAKTGMEPISLGLPETFKGRELYPHVEAWDSNFVEVLHPSPVLSISCPDGLYFNKDTYTRVDHMPPDPSALHDVSPRSSLGSETNKELNSSINSAKANWVLDDGTWVEVLQTNDEGDYGIGVSIYPFKVGNGMVGNPYSIGFRIHSGRYYGYDSSTGELINLNLSERFGSETEFPDNMIAGIKVDYTQRKLQYAHPQRIPIDFDLPETFWDKPLFPVIEVWNKGEAEWLRHESLNFSVKDE